MSNTYTCMCCLPIQYHVIMTTFVFKLLFRKKWLKYLTITFVDIYLILLTFLTTFIVYLKQFSWPLLILLREKVKISINKPLVDFYLTYETFCSLKVHRVMLSGFSGQCS